MTHSGAAAFAAIRYILTALDADHVAEASGHLHGIGHVALVAAQRDDGFTVQVVNVQYPHHSYGHYNLTRRQCIDQFHAIKASLRRAS